MSDFDDNEHRVDVDRQGNILIIRLDRPAKRNAIDPAMTQALDAALNELEDDPSLVCGVLSGRPVFSAGTDLALGSGGGTERGGPYGLAKRRRRTPLVAAIEGAALGGGLELALACDMVVAGESAQLGLPEVTRGVIPTCAGLFRGLQALPPMITKQLILTGAPVSAHRAYSLGLVNELAPDGQAEAVAIKLATSIGENSPFAVAECLEAMSEVLAQADDHGWALTEAALDRVLSSEDHREGIDAFLTKRAPLWTGR